MLHPIQCCQILSNTHSGEARRKLIVVLIRDVATGESGGVRPPNFRT